MILIADVGIKQAIPFHFFDVVNDFSLSKIGAISRDGLMPVSEDDNLIHACSK